MTTDFENPYMASAADGIKNHIISINGCSQPGRVALDGTRLKKSKALTNLHTDCS